MEAKGLNYWVEWLAAFQDWFTNRPAGIESDGSGWYEVEQVAYQDLAAIAEHFEVEHHAEDYNHRQKVEMTLMGTVTLIFYSPARRFTYGAIE
jgi:hypothetical protein